MIFNGSATVASKVEVAGSVDKIAVEAKEPVEVTATGTAQVKEVEVSAKDATVSVAATGTAKVDAVTVEAAATVTVAASENSTVSSVGVANTAAGATVGVTADGASTVSTVKVESNAAVSVAGTSTNTTTVQKTPEAASVTVTAPNAKVEEIASTAPSPSPSAEPSASPSASPSAAPSEEPASSDGGFSLTDSRISVYFGLNGGTLNGSTDTIEIKAKAGESINAPAAPAKEGTTFVKWLPEGDGKSLEDDGVEADASITVSETIKYNAVYQNDIDDEDENGSGDEDPQDPEEPTAPTIGTTNADVIVSKGSGDGRVKLVAASKDGIEYQMVASDGEPQADAWSALTKGTTGVEISDAAANKGIYVRIKENSETGAPASNASKYTLTENDIGVTLYTVSFTKSEHGTYTYKVGSTGSEVTVNSSTESAELSVDVPKDTQITITPTAETNYELDAITASGGAMDGTTVKVGTSNVTVAVTFKTS